MSSRRGQPGHSGGLVLASGLATLAGFVDAVGFLRLRGLFVSFMSGNTTALAVTAVGPHRRETLAYLSVIVCFLVGVTLGELLSGCRARLARPGVMVLVAVLLMCSAHLPKLELFVPSCTLAAAMGCQNAVLQRAAGEPVALTYVTGTLVHIGRSLADAIAGRASVRRALSYGALWSGMFVGAAFGAIASDWRIVSPIDIAAISALFFGAIMLGLQRRSPRCAMTSE